MSDGKIRFYSHEMLTKMMAVEEEYKKVRFIRRLKMSAALLLSGIVLYYFRNNFFVFDLLIIIFVNFLIFKENDFVYKFKKEIIEDALKSKLEGEIYQYHPRHSVQFRDIVKSHFFGQIDEVEGEDLLLVDKEGYNIEIGEITIKEKSVLANLFDFRKKGLFCKIFIEEEEEFSIESKARIINTEILKEGKYRNIIKPLSKMRKYSKFKMTATNDVLYLFIENLNLFQPRFNYKGQMVTKSIEEDAKLISDLIQILINLKVSNESGIF